MTRTVWKYQLSLTAAPQLRPMPRDAVVVHVAAQDDVPCLWAEVDPSRTLVDRWFTVVGTGQPTPVGAERAHHVGTALTHGDKLVWHVYEEQHR